MTDAERHYFVLAIQGEGFVRAMLRHLPAQALGDPAVQRAIAWLVERDIALRQRVDQLSDLREVSHGK